MNYADKSQAESLEVVSRKVFKEVKLSLVQDRKRFRRMEILLHLLITEAYSAI